MQKLTLVINDYLRASLNTYSLKDLLKVDPKLAVPLQLLRRLNNNHRHHPHLLLLRELKIYSLPHKQLRKGKVLLLLRPQEPVEEVMPPRLNVSETIQ